jgi:hypothetical protein
MSNVQIRQRALIGGHVGVEWERLEPSQGQKRTFAALPATHAILQTTSSDRDFLFTSCVVPLDNIGGVDYDIESAPPCRLPA